MPKSKERESEYNRQYHELNGAERNRTRRDRYLSDPDYAENRRIASREYRLRKKREKMAAIARGDMVAPESKLKKGPRDPVDINIGGEMVAGYTIPVVADKLGIKVFTFNNWLRAGIVPHSPYRAPRGDRLFSQAMIDAILKEIKKKGAPKLTKRDTQARADIVAAWVDAGVEMP